MQNVAVTVLKETLRGPVHRCRHDFCESQAILVSLRADSGSCTKKTKKGKAMHRMLMMLVMSVVVVVVACSNAVAQDEEATGAVPVELYACSYNDGKGPADLDVAIATWNAWADEAGFEDYSAWTLAPFYFSPTQEFDFLWLGVSPDAKRLGRAQDAYLATGGVAQAAFAEVIDCAAHVNFASLQYKEPPERDNPSNIVITFSDCNMEEGKTFDDVEPALESWAEYRTEHGSNAGMWVFFPAYGGGDAEFDFKWITSHANYEGLGADYDQYSTAGYEKAGELFAGLLDCDESRAYNALTRRRGETPE